MRTVVSSTSAAMSASNPVCALLTHPGRGVVIPFVPRVRDRAQCRFQGIGSPSFIQGTTNGVLDEPAAVTGPHPPV